MLSACFETFCANMDARCYLHWGEIAATHMFNSSQTWSSTYKVPCQCIPSLHRNDTFSLRMNCTGRPNVNLGN